MAIKGIKAHHISYVLFVINIMAKIVIKIIVMEVRNSPYSSISNTILQTLTSYA